MSPPAAVVVVAAWFADALTWDSFQHLSDEEMAQSMLNALTEAGYTLSPGDHPTIDYVREFHETYGVPTREAPTTDISPEERLVRVRLVLEEALEFADAMGCLVDVPCPGGFAPVHGDSVQIDINTFKQIDLVEAADALADIDYVTAGSALTLGIPHGEVVAEVHRSNMSKLGADGKPIYREGDNKVLKGPNYFKPNIAAVLGLDS